MTWGSGYINFVPTLLTSEVKKMFANKFAFAVIKENGTVLAWGDRAKGGSILNSLNILLVNVIGKSGLSLVI